MTVNELRFLRKDDRRKTMYSLHSVMTSKIFTNHDLQTKAWPKHHTTQALHTYGIPCSLTSKTTSLWGKIHLILGPYSCYSGYVHPISLTSRFLPTTLSKNFILKKQSIDLIWGISRVYKCRQCLHYLQNFYRAPFQNVQTLLVRDELCQNMTVRFGCAVLQKRHCVDSKLFHDKNWSWKNGLSKYSVHLIAKFLSYSIFMKYL